MKEDKKSNLKKSATKKTSTVKKTTSVKKVAPKKVETKKQPVKKTTAAKKTQVKKVSPKKATLKKETKIESKITQEELNKELVLRAVLIISYTLIIIFLLVGFVDSLINPPFTNDNINTSYLVSSNGVLDTKVIKLENAKKRFNNLSGDYFIYISYTGSEDINSFEKELVNIIDKYDIKKKFYYINVDDIVNKENATQLINNALGYTDVLVSKVPTIIYVNRNNIVRIENIITRDDNNMISIGDFQKLLDMNEFKEK